MATSRKIKLTPEQQQVFDSIVSSKESCFILGAAGVGKSTLLKELIKYYHQRCMVCAPTGVAALNVGGITLHSAFGINPDIPIKPDDYARNLTDKRYKILMSAEVVFIDEISMVRWDVMQYVYNTLFKHGFLKRGLKVVAIGDFYQLPPVMPSARSKKPSMVKEYYALQELWPTYDIDNGGYAFQTECWLRLFKRTYTLKNIVRQKDKGFASALNQIRCGEKEGLKYINERAQIISEKEAMDSIHNSTITLSAITKEVDRINQEALETLDSESQIYYAEEKGKVGQYPIEQKVIFKKEARVMCIMNIYNEAGVLEVSNGDTGTILDCASETVTVHFDRQGPVTIKKYKWVFYDYEIKEQNNKKFVELVEVGSYQQIPLRLAWACTIHKSQGKTFDSIILMQRGIRTVGQLYTALSRVRSVDGIKLVSPIHSKLLVTSQDVLEAFPPDGSPGSITIPKRKPEMKEEPLLEKPRTEKKDQQISNIKVEKLEMPKEQKASQERTKKQPSKTKEETSFDLKTESTHDSKEVQITIPKEYEYLVRQFLEHVRRGKRKFRIIG